MARRGTICLSLGPSTCRSKSKLRIAQAPKGRCWAEGDQPAQSAQALLCIATLSPIKDTAKTSFLYMETYT